MSDKNQDDEITPVSINSTEERDREQHESDLAIRAEAARRASEAVILGPVDPAVEERLADQGDLMGSTIRTTVIYTHPQSVERKDEEENGDVVGEGRAGITARDSLVPGRTESFVTAMTNLKTDDHEDDAIIDREWKTDTEKKYDSDAINPDRYSVVHDFPAPDDPTPTSDTNTNTAGVNTNTTTANIPNPATATATSGPSLSFAKTPPQTTRQQQATKEKEKTTTSLKTWWKSFSSGGSSSNSNTPVGGSSGTTTTAGAGPGAGAAGRPRANSARMRKGSVGEGYISETTPQEGDVFAQPLVKSLGYASVQISTAKVDGGLYIWGYVPVVVAKCGLYLKDTATEVPGTFRVSGSAKRMKELQAVFDNPPKYGKNLDWKKTTYTTHDVATILRRYLTQMPEPIVPHELYHEFRNNLLTCREHTPTAERSLDETIKTYQSLIGRMPKPNQYLLLYVLDLLSVFARKSEVNLMTAPNLAVIFQPGIISHTEHEMRPAEHALSQAVLEFLIEHQDHFLLVMQLEPIASRSSDAAGSTSDVFHPATSVVTSQSTRDEAETPVVAASLPKGSAILPGSGAVATETIATDKLVATTSPPEEASTTSVARHTSNEPKPTVATSVSPRPAGPPPPLRADPDLMVPSDSDDEAPVGGYYIKSEDPRRLQANIGPGGVIRSRTIMDRKSPRAIPIVQEYHSDPIEEEHKVGSPAKTSQRTGGLRAALSVRRTSRSSPRVVSTDRPSSAREAPPGVIIVDNPPLAGVIEGGPGASRLFRRRTAPTRRHRNKDEDEVLRKQAEEAVKKVGKGPRKEGSAEV